MPQYVDKRELFYKLYDADAITAGGIEIFRNFPVVEIVRCKECVFHEVADYGEGYTKNVCRLLSRQIQNDDFCSYGLRMDSEGE